MQNALAQAVFDAIVRFRDALGGPAEGAAPLTPRRAAFAALLAVSAVAIGWLLFVGLPRWYAVARPGQGRRAAVGAE